jgi:hypothetical protein
MIAGNRLIDLFWGCLPAADVAGRNSFDESDFQFNTISYGRLPAANARVPC